MSSLATGNSVKLINLADFRGGLDKLTKPCDLISAEGVVSTPDACDVLGSITGKGLVTRPGYLRWLDAGSTHRQETVMLVDDFAPTGLPDAAVLTVLEGTGTTKNQTTSTTPIPANPNSGTTGSRSSTGGSSGSGKYLSKLATPVPVSPIAVTPEVTSPVTFTWTMTAATGLVGFAIEIYTANNLTSRTLAFMAGNAAARASAATAVTDGNRWWRIQALGDNINAKSSAWSELKPFVVMSEVYTWTASPAFKIGGPTYGFGTAESSPGVSAVFPAGSYRLQVVSGAWRRGPDAGNLWYAHGVQNHVIEGTGYWDGLVFLASAVSGGGFWPNPDMYTQNTLWPQGAFLTSALAEANLTSRPLNFSMASAFTAAFTMRTDGLGRDAETSMVVKLYKLP
jgi:hypothetical protein